MYSSFQFEDIAWSIDHITKFCLESQWSTFCKPCLPSSGVNRTPTIWSYYTTGYLVSRFCASILWIFIFLWLQQAGASPYWNVVRSKFQTNLSFKGIMSLFKFGNFRKQKSSNMKEMCCYLHALSYRYKWISNTKHMELKLSDF